MNRVQWEQPRDAARHQSNKLDPFVVLFSGVAAILFSLVTWEASSTALVGRDTDRTGLTLLATSGFVAGVLAAVIGARGLLEDARRSAGNTGKHSANGLTSAAPTQSSR